MNCGKARSLMLDHLYGDLGQRKQKALNKHLRACRECSRELDAHKATVSTFSNLRMEEPPLNIGEKIVAVAEREVERRKRILVRSPWYWRPALAAVAATALVVVCVVYYLPVAKMDKMAPRDYPAMMQRGRIFDQLESMGTVSKEETYEAGSGARADGKLSELSVESAPYGMGEEISRSEIVGEKYPEKEIEYSIPAVGGQTSLADSPPARIELRKQAADVSAELRTRESLVVKPTGVPAISNETLEEALWDKKQVTERALDHDATADEVLGEGKSKYQTAREEFSKGDAYFKNLDFRRAASNYEEVINLEPQSMLAIEARYRLGQSYQKMDMCEEAVSVYDEIVQKYADFHAIAEVYIAAGECYLEMGEIEDALRNFEIVRGRFPTHREVAQRKIELAISQQEAAEESNEQPPTEPE